MPNGAWTAVALTGIGLGLWLLARLLRACEAKGWIRLRGSSDGGVSSAFLQIHRLLEPKVAHVERATQERALKRETPSPTPPEFPSADRGHYLPK